MPGGRVLQRSGVLRGRVKRPFSRFLRSAIKVETMIQPSINRTPLTADWLLREYEGSEPCELIAGIEDESEFVPFPPTIAVEVISSHDRFSDVEEKADHCPSLRGGLDSRHNVARLSKTASTRVPMLPVSPRRSRLASQYCPSLQDGLDSRRRHEQQ
jgi:hypothetical protein